MIFFHFDEQPVIKNNITFYKIVNDVERKIRSTDKYRLKVGASGGYVQFPEFLDPTQNIWIYETAKIFGKTYLTGRISIKNAEIYDCNITGNVWIGSTSANAKHYPDDVLYNTSLKVRIKNSEINSKILTGDKSDEVEAHSLIQLFDTAYIENSKIFGCSKIDGRTNILRSTVFSSELTDYTALINSVATGNSKISGSPLVFSSKIDSCIIDCNYDISNRDLMGCTM